MDKTVILKQTNNGLVIDTIINSNDSLHLKADYHTTVSIPDNTIKVILPEKSNMDIFSTWAIIIGGLAGLAGAIIAFSQLFKKDRNKEKQINELIAQTQEIKEQTRINQARLRMLVKPRIWSNGGGRVGGRLTMDLSNRGELAFYDGCEIVEGDNVEFQKWQNPIGIEKEGNITLTAPAIDKKLNDIQFRIKILYHDQENFKYKTIFDWKGGAPTLIETNEL